MTSLKIVKKYDGPHRCEGMLVERPGSETPAEPSAEELVELLGSPVEVALWAVERVARLMPRNGAAPIDLFHLRRTG